MLQSVLIALNDPASIYFQYPASTPYANKQLTAAAQPLSSLRSVLRRAYFSYLYYYPEMRFGLCVMRYASNSDAEAVYEAPSISQQGAATPDSGLDNAEIASTARNVDDKSSLLPDAYSTLAVTLQRLLHQFVCTDNSDGDGGDDGVADKCALAKRHAQSAPPAVDDATLRLYKTLALNMAEQWMRSRRLLQPALSETGARRVRYMAEVVLDGMVRGMRERLVPGLYGCTQHYLLEMLWRSVETWL